MMIYLPIDNEEVNSVLDALEMSADSWNHQEGQARREEQAAEIALRVRERLEKLA